MVKWKIALVGAAMAVAPMQAQAATYLETFDEPFAQWENRFFGTQSNAQNYYVVQPSASGPDFRGANNVGLWLSDGGNYLTDSTANINIRFDAAFAATITDLSFDLLSLLGPSVAAKLTFLDGNGAAIGSTVVLPEGAYGSLNDPQSYKNYAVSSANGISGFDIIGYADGNVSIDNVSVKTAAAAVPEPATWMMMIGGFGVVGAAMRRRRTTVRFA